MPEADAVEMNNLRFSYESNLVLRDVNLRIAPNEQVCIVGPNGGGKTTLVKLILGLLKPQHGTVRVFGGHPSQQRKRIGYTPQHSLFDPTFPVNVTDVVMMGRVGKAGVCGPYRRADRAAATEALAEVGLTDHRRRPFADLSGGQRQRVLIARALASQPDLLLLDEPTANLDVGVEQEFYQLLGELGQRMAIVMVSHDIGFVSELVDTVICVQGTVAVHPTTELTGELMRDLYGREIRLVRHDHDCLTHPEWGCTDE